LGLWTIALFGLWLALVGTVAGLELIAGVVAALIGAIAVEVVRSRGLLLGIDPRWLAGLRRPLVQVFVDFFVVMGALARTLATRRPPDDRCLVVDLSGAGGDQRSPGWRAYAAAAGSLAPNSVVIDVERERRRMLVHKLVPESGPPRPL
jgi:multisubunit Na+/H+ antiporter MnhE subunit